MSSLSPEQVGAGAAVSNTTREVGGTLGVAVLGSVFASSFSTKAAVALTSGGLPPKEAATASDSVAVALGTAQHLGSSTVASVSNAFMDGLHVACFTAAGVALLGAVVIAGLLKGQHDE